MQQKPHDITEIIAHLDLSKGVRRADRIVNGFMVLALVMIYGDLVYKDALHPEYAARDGSPFVLTADIGCLDAPLLMPAGSMERHEASLFNYAFPSLSLWGRDNEERT